MIFVLTSWASIQCANPPLLRRGRAKEPKELNIGIGIVTLRYQPAGAYHTAISAHLLSSVHTVYTMAERFAIVYFLRAKNADILPLSSIHGDCAVGETRRVTWHDKAYSAKVTFSVFLNDETISL